MSSFEVPVGVKVVHAALATQVLVVAFFLHPNNVLAAQSASLVTPAVITVHASAGAEHAVSPDTKAQALPVLILNLEQFSAFSVSLAPLTEVYPVHAALPAAQAPALELPVGSKEQ